MNRLVLASIASEYKPTIFLLSFRLSCFFLFHFITYLRICNMKKALSLIFGLVVIFSCITVAHAWPLPPLLTSCMPFSLQYR